MIQSLASDPGYSLEERTRPLLQPPEDGQAWCCMAGVAYPPARLQHCCFTLLAARTAAAVQHKACGKGRIDAPDGGRALVWR
jgi:hypothetical protein